MAVLEGTGGDVPGDEAVAGMLQHVSDSAARAGGRIIDVREMLMARARGEDSALREEGFERETGIGVEDLVAAVREAAEELGVGDTEQRLNLTMTETAIPGQKIGRLGLSKGNENFVRDTGDNERDALMVLHELAHSVASHDHAESWKDVYVGAVRRAMGDELAENERERVEGRYNAEGDDVHLEANEGQ